MNVRRHINKMKESKNVVISIDAEKSILTKLNIAFHDKNIQQSRNGRKLLWRDKGHMPKPTADMMLSEKLEGFLSRHLRLL